MPAIIELLEQEERGRICEVHRQGKGKQNHRGKQRKRRERQVKQVKRGEVYWAELNGDAIGSEQTGKRPVLILQNDVGNRYSPTTIIACITSQLKTTSLPTHVKAGVEHGLPKESIILLEQVQTISKERLKDKITKLDDEIMKQVNHALLISLSLE